ncbi:uncharacterized protein [Miscanthus floridulus]|uniref:uncharacterized protein n=1 Tax=Miscanthus floridulus TaxID=154761 RepID=UPI0034595D98
MSQEGSQPHTELTSADHSNCSLGIAVQSAFPDELPTAGLAPLPSIRRPSSSRLPSAARKEEGAGSAAAKEEGAGSAATEEEKAGAAATEEEKAGTAATEEDKVGSAATEEEKA